MIAWPDTLIATSEATQDDLNLVTQYNLLLAASMELESTTTALTRRIEDVEDVTAGSTKNLLIRQSRVSPNSDVLITADKLAMTSGLTLDDVDVQCDLGDAGAGGLDTGTATANTWYYFFVIGDSTEVLDPEGFISTSPAPTLPDGYDVISEPLVVLPTDSDGHLHGFQWIDGMVYISSNEDLDTVSGGAVDRVDLVSVGSGWTDIDLSAIQPPGCDDILVRFWAEQTASSADEHRILYGKPTWAVDAVGEDGYSYQRRLFELSAPYVATVGGETIRAVSPDRWLELDSTGHYLFAESSAGAWDYIYLAIIGYRFRP